MLYLLLERTDSDVHAISVIVLLIVIAICIPIALADNARKKRESQGREDERIRSIERLETQSSQPDTLHLPKSAGKYSWAIFYVRRPTATFIYLKTNGARMQRKARMVALGVDENGDGVLGCFESGQFRVFYTDRIQNLMPISDSAE